MSRIVTTRITGIKDTPYCFQDYDTVNVLSWHKKDTPYYELSPYHLKTDGNEEAVNPGGVIFENFWQGQKVYPWIYPIEIYTHYSKKGDPRFLLYQSKHNEPHLDSSGQILPDYYRWRNEIFGSTKALRYPNGFNHRHECKFLLLIKEDNTQERLDYISARKRVYCQEYKRLARKLPVYQRLLRRLRQDPNYKICISEIDVPCFSKKGSYHCEDPYFECTLQNLEVLLNDPSEAYGHGLCLATALLEDLSF